MKQKKYRTIKHWALATLVGVAVVSDITAQVQAPFLSPQLEYNDAEAGVREQLFKSYSIPQSQSLMPKLLQGDFLADHFNFEYLKALAAVTVGKLDSAQISSNHPAYLQRLSLAKARHYFKKGQWAEALVHYKQCGIANLDNEEIIAAKFEMAYCHFNNKQFAEAKALLQTMKGIEGKYSPVAHYYYGLLAYNEGAYAQAKESFEKIADHKEYNRVVPYYLAEIAYFMNNKVQALEQAKTIIAHQEQNYYLKEAHLLAAQCLFEDRQYAAAIPYFEYYYNRVEKIRKQDLYKMGYCYYRNGQWSQAVESFVQLSVVQDALGQNAMYLLGDCYLKTKDKKGAKNAFATCSRMEFDPSLVEPALLLSGQLAFELGYSTEGAIQLNRLIREFPSSTYKPQASAVLSEQLIRSGNYTEAHQLLSQQDNVPHSLMQKAAYGLAMQKMQDRQWSEAEQLLLQAKERDADKNYFAASCFWLAEIYYRNKNFAQSLSQSQLFLQLFDPAAMAAISPNATYQNASMTAGYAALNLQEFAQAKHFFAQAQKQNSGARSQTLWDAVLREADAAFLDKDYPLALEQYNKVILQKNTDFDYAQFQKSTLLGLMGKSADQVEILQSIVAQKNLESKFKYEAHYALGDLYLDAHKFEDAIAHFQKITPQTAKHLAAKAMMKVAFAYQEADNINSSIDGYKKVLALYPSTEEGNAALDALKSLFVATNQPNAYVQLLKDFKLNVSDRKDLDSVFYNAAESQFIAAKYAQALQSFDTYLSQYPQGVFYTKANYYKAECHLQLKQNDQAFKSFALVSVGAWNDFTEQSALKAAQIAAAQKQWDTARKYYEVLRINAVGKENLKLSYKGLMNAAYSNKQIGTARLYADTLMLLPDLDEQTKAEATMVFANDLLQQQKFDEAFTQFELLSSSKHLEINAEAHYRLAEIWLLRKKLTEAEQAAQKSIRVSSSQPYWNAKSYLLIADVFVAQKDYFNAKATLQSIVKNLKIEELKKEASVKLEQIKALEQGKSKLTEG